MNDIERAVQEADDARRKAEDATPRAFRTKNREHHVEAARLHSAAATAARNAATKLAMSNENDEVDGYLEQAARHDAAQKLHESYALDGPESKTAGQERSIAAARGSDGKPQSRIMATAQGMQAEAPGRYAMTTHAVDAYLHTPAGDQDYREYRARILGGDPSLPKSIGSRSAK